MAYWQEVEERESESETHPFSLLQEPAISNLSSPPSGNTDGRLILASGETFPGYAPAYAEGIFPGEAVFATGMAGYVESLTDPSYAGQILVFTYPLIGNYPVGKKDSWESDRIWPVAVVVGECGPENFLPDWLYSQGVPLLRGVDTRALTRVLRSQGTVLAQVEIASSPILQPMQDHPEGEIASIPQLAAIVCCKEKKLHGKGKIRVVLVDCGMKKSILRHLLHYPVEVLQVPYNYDYSDEEFDGLLISNGPGDPMACQETIGVLKKALTRNKPTFGICLGAQLLNLAIGGKTYKLPFGHRGQNHPCLDLIEKRAILTSQNHGYAISEAHLPETWQVSFRSLNDGSVEGIRHQSLPIAGVQFHPESSPGPTDAAYLFDQFYQWIKKQ